MRFVERQGNNSDGGDGGGVCGGDIFDVGVCVCDGGDGSCGGVCDGGICGGGGMGVGGSGGGVCAAVTLRPRCCDYS